jgi:hypothetical protein
MKHINITILSLNLYGISSSKKCSCTRSFLIEKAQSAACWLTFANEPSAASKAIITAAANYLWIWTATIRNQNQIRNGIISHYRKGSGAITKDCVQVPCQLIFVYNNSGGDNCKIEIPTMLLCPTSNWIRRQTYKEGEIGGPSEDPVQ